jgi:hypothetical protein
MRRLLKNKAAQRSYFGKKASFHSHIFGISDRKYEKILLFWHFFKKNSCDFL